MPLINALSCSPNAHHWIHTSRQLRILHIFDNACNLLNERGEVLSVVSQKIGNGPFNLVVQGNDLFTELLSTHFPVFTQAGQLHIGDWIIQTEGAALWNPRPNWEMLHAGKDDILNRLTQLLIPNYLPTIQQLSNSLVSISLISNLCSSLVTNDISTAKSLAAKLAGLGIGLTPSGDDFLMGALYASWIIHPHEIASQLALEISEVTAPITTSLSAAWLRSAGKGEAGALWHNLFNSLILPVPNPSTSLRTSLESPIPQILSTGETSGADTLAGFLGTLISYAEVDTKPCPS